MKTTRYIQPIEIFALASGNKESLELAQKRLNELANFRNQGYVNVIDIESNDEIPVYNEKEFNSLDEYRQEYNLGFSFQRLKGSEVAKSLSEWQNQMHVEVSDEARRCF